MCQDHIENLARRLYKVVYQIRKLKLFCNHKTVIAFYDLNFESVLSYGLIYRGYLTRVTEYLKFKKVQQESLTKLNHI